MADSRYIHLLFVAPENDHICLSNSLKRHDFAAERTGNLSDACQILSDKNESRFDAVLATELAKLPAVAIQQTEEGKSGCAHHYGKFRF